MPDGTLPPDRPSLTSRNSLLLILGLGMGVLSYSMTQMMVVPALPAISRDLGAGPTGIAWIISAYLLSTSVATPLFGQLGDVLGRANVLIATLAIATVGSLLGMTAETTAQLVAARVLQAVGGAAFPLAYGQARELLPPHRVPVAIGLISGSFGIGGSLGLVISGPLTDAVSWRAIFLVSLVLSLGGILCVWWTRALSVRERDRSVDWRGAIAVTAGATCILLAISEGNRLGWLRAALPLALAGALVLALWWRRAAHQDDPVLDVRMIRSPTIWPAHLLALALGFCMYSNGYLIPLFTQSENGLDESVTVASMVLLPAMLAGMLSGYLSGILSRRSALLPAILGAMVMLTGYVSLIVLHDTVWQVALGALFAHGIGMNLLYSAVATIVTVRSPATRSSEAAGVNSAARTVGGSFGSQISALLITSTAFTGAGGYTMAFALLAAVMLVSTVFCLAVPQLERRAAEAGTATA